MSRNNKMRGLWLSSSKGSTTIEFSLVFIPFIMAMLFLAELSRVVYISSALNLILAESGYRTSLRSPDSDYETFFSQALEAQLAGWPLFSKSMTLELSALYCDNVTMLVDSGRHCSSTNAVGKPLAFYSVSVKYQPLFFILPKTPVESKLNRKVVFVQEFQRGKL